MTHISKRKLKKETANQLVDHLLTFLSTARGKRKAHVLAQELFTQTERVMLAKRLAIIYMLVAGYRFSEIEDEIGITNQTVCRISLRLQNGEFRELQRLVSQRAQPGQESTMEHVLKILSLGLPPKVGPGRLRHWKKYFAA